MNSARRQKLWKMHDAYMKEWDAIEEQEGKLFEETHRWLFHPGEKPEIIENEDTIEKEDHLNQKRTNIIKRLSEVMAELFPPKEPTPPKQEQLLPGTPEIAWSDR